MAEMPIGLNNYSIQMCFLLLVGIIFLSKSRVNLVFRKSSMCGKFMKPVGFQVT